MDKAEKFSMSVAIDAHLQDLYTRTVEGLKTAQCKQAAGLLIKRQPAFSESDKDLEQTVVIRYRIIKTETRPIKQPLRRLPVYMNEEADKQIKEMFKKDVIQSSTSPWASGIVMVTKNDGSKRFALVIGS